MFDLNMLNLHASISVQTQCIHLSIVSNKFKLNASTSVTPYKLQNQSQTIMIETMILPSYDSQKQYAATTIKN